MPFTLDPQVATALAPIMAATEGVDPPKVGDIATRRENAEGLFGLITAGLPANDQVTRTSYTTKAEDGTDVALTWFAPPGEAPGSAALYIHGGGMIFGNLTQYDAIIARYVADSGVPMLAVEYRLAPEFPDPTPVQDCYAGLAYLAEHATELGVDPTRIAVIGDSAGGGLTAGVTLLAHDRGGPAIAQQILIYPMLDDRNTTPDPEIAPMAVWTYDDNITGWDALLGDKAGGDGVSVYAAPARREDFAGLPPTYIDVGEIDIFRDEDVHYAARLSAAGVPVELHLHPGAPHAFEGLAPTSDVGARAIADRVRRLRSL